MITLFTVAISIHKVILRRITNTISFPRVPIVPFRTLTAFSISTNSSRRTWNVNNCAADALRVRAKDSRRSSIAVTSIRVRVPFIATITRAGALNHVNTCVGYFWAINTGWSSSDKAKSKIAFTFSSIEVPVIVSLAITTWISSCSQWVWVTFTINAFIWPKPKTTWTRTRPTLFFSYRCWRRRTVSTFVSTQIVKSFLWASTSKDLIGDQIFLVSESRLASSGSTYVRVIVWNKSIVFDFIVIIDVCFLFSRAIGISSTTCTLSWAINTPSTFTDASA